MINVFESLAKVIGHRHHQILVYIANTTGYPLQPDGKTLLLKIPQDYIIKHVEI